MGRMQDVFAVALAMMAAMLYFTMAAAFVQPNSFFPSQAGYRNSAFASRTNMINSRSRSSAVVALQASGEAAANDEALGLAQKNAPPALSVPVFSLATVNEDGSTNMNIVTYATPVGIEPERLWMVSMFKSTLSYDNFLREGWGVLQLLRQKHAPLVPVLGHRGGRETDKMGTCTSEAFPWVQPPRELLSVPRSIAIAPDCASYITLHVVRKQSAGDHDAFICRIGSVVGPEEDQQNVDDPEWNILESGHLRAGGII